ncbi:hypothetical protein R3P38DRAFT_3238921 [Favolaschia claudopus]|uniref:Uncharacterized protein n=1 Tax=Favolaschia claudopus TaxID=2862362 RepID=A0AAV9Z9B2_9AGAR
MRLSLVVNGTLVVLLAITNHRRLVALAEWVYSALGSPFTIPAILVFYGLILIYLLVSVYNLGNTEVASTRCRRTRLVPYYNSEGQLKGWYERRRNLPPSAQTNLLTAGAYTNHRLLLKEMPASAPAKSTTPLPLPPASASAPAPLSLEYGTAFRMVASGAISRLNNWKDTSQLAIYWVGGPAFWETRFTNRCDT